MTLSTKFLATMALPLLLIAGCNSGLSAQDRAVLNNTRQAADEAKAAAQQAADAANRAANASQAAAADAKAAAERANRMGSP